MTSGKVYDIRTGREMARVRDLTAFFQQQMRKMVENDVDFYVVYGRCKHKDVRAMISLFQSLHGDVLTIWDPSMPPDTVWLFEGEPGELGYSS